MSHKSSHRDAVNSTKGLGMAIILSGAILTLMCGCGVIAWAVMS